MTRCQCSITVVRYLTTLRARFTLEFGEIQWVPVSNGRSPGDPSLPPRRAAEPGGRTGGYAGARRFHVDNRLTLLYSAVTVPAGSVPKNSLSGASNYLKFRHFTKKKKKKVSGIAGSPVGTLRPGRFCICLRRVTWTAHRVSVYLEVTPEQRFVNLCKCFLWGKITCLT